MKSQLDKYIGVTESDFGPILWYDNGTNLVGKGKYGSIILSGKDREKKLAEIEWGMPSND